MKDIPKVRPSRSPLFLRNDARPHGLAETGRLIDRPTPFEPTERFDLTPKGSRLW